VLPSKKEKHTRQHDNTQNLKFQTFNFEFLLLNSQTQSHSEKK
jgi:hypothetical protein